MSFEEGTLVFYCHEEHSWVLGTVSGPLDPKKGYPIKDRDYNAGTVYCEADALYRVNNQAILEEDVDDLLLLSELHQSTLLNTLRLRYLKDVVYTYIGPIVIAINPFNYNIPWYKDDFMPHYLVEGPVIQKNKPHSWSVAHNTYYEMLNDRQDQCVLVSGESGAGKTEAVKIVLKYIRGLMNKLARDETHRQQLADVNAKVLMASPILESFGNAKTGRNDNSSRFGKFLKIQFNTEGFITGSYAINYLLEKSRIVTAAKGERIYHSFYQVAKGKDKAKYKLGDPTTYPSLIAGGTLDNASMEDAEGDDLSFRMTNEAYAQCGVSLDEADSVWRIVASVLHMVKMVFQPDGDKCKLDAASDDALTTIAELLKVPLDELRREMLTTTTVLRGETIVVNHSVPIATAIRDTLAVSIYKFLFDWMFLKLNAGTSSDDVLNWIGLLDIFGFEDFPVNSFEQLCINLANETLQNHYNSYIFTRDMEECKSEGIDITDVAFVDNSSTCDMLINKRNGIFQLLDDECALGKGTDLGFLEKITTEQSSHPSYEKKSLWKDCFAVKHYAGTVKYMVDGFLVKNKDILKDSFKTILRSSTDPVTAVVMPEPVEKKGRAITVSGFFVDQIRQLMDTINSTNPHWIRCIKPHPAKKPKLFHGVQSMGQMISAGIIETVRIRMLGFPVRLKHFDFAARFKCIALEKGSAPDIKADTPAACADILKAAGYGSNEGQVGKTKVFLKSHIYQDIEAQKRSVMHKHAIKVQMFARRMVVFPVVVERINNKNKDIIAALKAQLVARKAILDAAEAAVAAVLSDADREYADMMKDHDAYMADYRANYETRMKEARAKQEAAFAEARTSALEGEEAGRCAIIDEYEKLSAVLAAVEAQVALQIAERAAAAAERAEARAAAQEAERIERAARATERAQRSEKEAADLAARRTAWREDIMRRRQRRNMMILRVEELTPGALVPARARRAGDALADISASMRTSMSPTAGPRALGASTSLSPRRGAESASPRARYAPDSPRSTAAAMSNVVAQMRSANKSVERELARASTIPSPQPTRFSAVGAAVEAGALAHAAAMRSTPAVPEGFFSGGLDGSLGRSRPLFCATESSLPFSPADPEFLEYITAYRMLGNTATVDDVTDDTVNDVWYESDVRKAPVRGEVADVRARAAHAALSQKLGVGLGRIGQLTAKDVERLQDAKHVRPLPPCAKSASVFCWQILSPPPQLRVRLRHLEVVPPMYHREGRERFPITC